MQAMFSRPIVVYSDFCAHSEKFLQLLLRVPELNQQFVRLNIDVDPTTRRRPDAFYQIQTALQHKILEVPTIIVENASYVLSGEQAFKWIEYQHSQTQKKRGLEAFCENEMGSFSDMYARFGSTDLNDATEQSFKFIKKQDEFIQTPPESDVGANVDFKSKERERESFDASSCHTGQQKEWYGNFDFTGQTAFGDGGRAHVAIGSEKQRDIDSRLEQLMSERERMMPRPPPMQFGR